MPNAKPVLFIGSATECRPTAEAVKFAIPGTSAVATLWTQGGVFGFELSDRRSRRPQLRVADFTVLGQGPMIE